MVKTHTLLFKISSISIYIYIYVCVCVCVYIYIYIYMYINRLLRHRTVSEKQPKILIFGPSLIHQLMLLGYQQHSQPESL
jgi:hypothetical protein